MTTQTVKSDSKSAKSLFRSDAMQRMLAFGALIVLFIGFSLASPYFRTFDNIVGILLATAVNGVLALGVTFVIITAGIDLSVGTVMTFSAVMTGVFITNWHLPVPVGILGGVLAGTLAGLVNGNVISRMKIPPFIATLGMLYIAKGLSLVISELKPIYFNDTPAFREMAMGSVLGKIIPGFEVPNAVFIMFGAAIHCPPDPVTHDPGTLHLCAGQQRRSHPPFGCQCGIAGRPQSIPCADCSPGWAVY